MPGTDTRCTRPAVGVLTDRAPIAGAAQPGTSMRRRTSPASGVRRRRVVGQHDVDVDARRRAARPSARRRLAEPADRRHAAPARRWRRGRAWRPILTHRRRRDRRYRSECLRNGDAARRSPARTTRSAPTPVRSRPTSRVSRSSASSTCLVYDHVLGADPDSPGGFRRRLRQGRRVPRAAHVLRLAAAVRRSRRCGSFRAGDRPTAGEVVTRAVRWSTPAA